MSARTAQRTPQYASKTPRKNAGRGAQLHEVQADEPDFDQRQREHDDGDRRADAMFGADRPRHDCDSDESSPDISRSGVEK